MFFDSDSVGLLLCREPLVRAFWQAFALDLGVVMPRGPDELRWHFLCKMCLLRLVDF